MANQITRNFDFENKSVHVFQKFGEAFFVGVDVARALGYKNTRDALSKHVEKDDKNTVAIYDGIGNPNRVVINESGVFSLIFSSKLRKAKKFKHWVTSKVLPSIFHNGGYQLPQTPEQKLNYLAVNASKSINNLDGRVTKLESNQVIGPSDYGYLNKEIARKVYQYTDAHHMAVNNKQRSKLFKDIGSGIKQITGVRCRSHLRAQDFDKVCKYVNQWVPSTATLTVIHSMKNNKQEV